jgi:gamma-glutamyltranspeptidase / glutathione hydrolase
MKYSISFSLYFLVLLAIILRGAPAGNTAAQTRQSGEVKMSPEAWPQGELEKYWQLQKDYSRRQQAVESTQGMVAVTSDAFAARVGMEALRQGGGAADAALSAAIAQVALKGGATISYAGILMMVYYDAADKKVYSLNAGYNTVQEEKDPLTIPGSGEPSGRSALTPGFFAGAQAAHDRFGKLRFASLFEPAIYLAEKGVVVDRALGFFINSQKVVLTRLPETKRIFTKENGELYKTGDLFKQPQLAETLRKVASQGADYIYQGEWAKKFVAATQSGGGKMTLADLKAYRPIWSEPLQTSYRGYQVYSLGHPSLGGVNTIEALNLLEAADLKQRGHYTTAPESLYEFIQICRAGLFLSFAPAIIKTHLPELDLTPESRVKKESAGLLWRKMGEPAWQKTLSELKPKSEGDNHSAGVVAVDARGDVAAVLHSINSSHYLGGGIFVDGISIPDSASIQQGKIAGVKPGDRLPEVTDPLIVLKDGKPYLASSCIGSGLHQTTMNNLVNVLDFDMDLKKSIDTPNFMGPFAWNSLWGAEALAEGDFDENLVRAVIAKGQAIKLLSKTESMAQRGYWVAIQIDAKTGKRVGVAPSGNNGCVAGY